MNAKELQLVLELHAKWLRNEVGGVRADLRRANLSRASLSGASLSGASLSGANLSRADLSRANLSRASLSGAYLSGASLSGAYLSRADLSGANLSRADLSRADLSGANLVYTTLDYPIYQAFLGQYNIHTNAKYIRIGCMYKLVSEWLSLTEGVAVELGLHPSHYKDYMAFVQWYANKLGKENI